MKAQAVRQRCTHRCADQPFRMACHKIDILLSCKFRRADHISFIFPGPDHPLPERSFPGAILQVPLLRYCIVLFLHLLLPPVRSITHFYPVLLYALHSGPGISSHQIPYSSNNSMVSPPHFPAGSDGVRNFLIYFPTISFSRFTLSPAFFFSSVVSSPV